MRHIHPQGTGSYQVDRHSAQNIMMYSYIYSMEISRYVYFRLSVFEWNFELLWMQNAFSWQVSDVRKSYLRVLTILCFRWYYVPSFHTFVYCRNSSKSSITFWGKKLRVCLLWLYKYSIWWRFHLTFDTSVCIKH